MRLADFITTHTDDILAEWVTFAATAGPVGMARDWATLGDHAREMLTAIVADLRTPQTDAEQTAKSKGHAPAAPLTAASAGASHGTHADTPAEVHGAGRAESGFTLDAMVAEYRALRASVIRLWTATNGTLTGADLEDLMRFNEAIDQSLAESITRYTLDLERSKEMFLAVLGHDLRTPLGAVLMSSQFMLDTGELAEPHLTLTTRIVGSARRMNAMVGDLLDFTRSRLGSGVPIARAQMDLGAVARQAVDEVAAAQPGSVLQFETSGDLRGAWDAARLSQMLTNLLGNAVQHGAAGTAIRVRTDGEAGAVVLRVQNRGPAIPPVDLPDLFSPLKRLRASDPAANASGNLGLGLYIAEGIVTAHGGTIAVTSSAGAGTEVTVRLPR